MILPEFPHPYRELETIRKNLADKIIEISVKGGLCWDFDSFDDVSKGQVAVARLAGFIFVSTHIREEAGEFSIFVGEDAHDTVEIDTFGGYEAYRIREVLGKLAWQDKGYMQRRREKIRRSANQEMFNLELFKGKKKQLCQVLELLAV